jgi:2-succinyl-6-hydroxy-2,4-cyclohexadiene-1-carboxylate synthase
MPTFTVNNIQYHATLTGSGPPLLLLHGFTGAAANWHPHAAALAAQRTIITVDLLGHGNTDAPPDADRYTMPLAAADLISLVQQIAAPPFDLLGYSMGGRLALYIALHYPDAVQSLVLESASPGLRTEAERSARRDKDDALANRIEREGVPAFVDFWEALPLWDSQHQLANATREQLRQQRLQNRPHGLANSLRGMGTGVQPSLWGKLNQLQAPTLLITGEYDAKFITLADEMAAHIPQVGRVTIAGAGHTPHLEQPGAFQQAVIDFLEALR